MSHQMAMNYMKSQRELAHAKKVVDRLEKAILIYCREKAGSIDFKNDQEAIEYFIKAAEKYEQ